MGLPYFIVGAVFVVSKYFWIAQYPMDGIDWSFSQLTAWMNSSLPKAWWSDLLINGLMAGLNGILVLCRK